MTPDFNADAFHRKRKVLKLAGLTFILLGAFTFVDILARFPIPLMMPQKVFLGTFFLLLGIACIYNGYKLPLNEAISLIHDRNRGICESELIHEMKVDRVTAARILAALARKGFLRRSDAPNQAEEVFTAVR